MVLEYCFSLLKVTAQVLRKKNSIVCQTTPDVLNSGKTGNPTGMHILLHGA